MQLQLASEIDFDGWRRQARSLAARAIPADDVHWRINGTTSLLDDPVDIDTAAAASAARNEIRVPRRIYRIGTKGRVASQP